MTATSSMLVEIRQALVDRATMAAAAAGIADVQFEADFAEVSPVRSEIVRPRFALPRREQIAYEGAPMIRQTGRFVVQVLLPNGTGYYRQQDAIETIASFFTEQTLPGGIRLFGDADTIKTSQDQVRQTWEIGFPWETIRHEFNAGDQTPVTALQSSQDQLMSVRRVWESRIEQPDALTGWAGMTTLWDCPPTEMPAAPATPWAGYWIQANSESSIEIDGATEQVVGRALVQIHTDPRGYVATLRIVERILAEHNRSAGSVAIGPADPVAQFRSTAGTLQTNLRIPFRFERAR